MTWRAMRSPSRQDGVTKHAAANIEAPLLWTACDAPWEIHCTVSGKEFKSMTRH